MDLLTHTRRQPRVVIVGGGFGGLWSLRTLASAHVDVVLVDRNNYHTFLPLLYQVAAAEIEPEEIAYPLRSLLRKRKNTSFHMAEVSEVDLQARVLRTAASAISYDFLILAIGSTTHFFGVPGAVERAFPLRTMEQGIALRNHILSCFEQAAHESDIERRRRLLTFVVVGGGPTGVEFSGALAELLYGPLRDDYPTLDSQEVRLLLVEAMDTLLPGLPDKLRDYSLHRLRRMGVDVRLQATVSEVMQAELHLKDGSVIPSETIVWTAGVRGAPQVQSWGLPTSRDGRVPVLPTLQATEHPEVYVIGDLARVEVNGRPLPMIAPVAIQQGVTAAQNIVRQIGKKEPEPFRYIDRGTMVTIGRNAAVANVFGRNFTGFIAWMLWVTVHLFNLIGFRNRLFVLINWAWDYFFYERTVRLILPNEPPSART